MTDATDDITREELDAYLRMLEIANNPANYSFELDMALEENQSEE